MKLVIEVVQVDYHAKCGKETWVVTEIRNILCIAEGSIDHTNVKDEHERVNIHFRGLKSLTML